MPPAAPLALNGALPSPTRSHYQPKSVQRAEKRLGVTTEYADLSLHSASANGNLGECAWGCTGWELFRWIEGRLAW